MKYKEFYFPGRARITLSEWREGGEGEGGRHKFLELCQSNRDDVYRPKQGVKSREKASLVLGRKETKCDDRNTCRIDRQIDR